MLIDLTTPQIVFKDKMFWINSDGSIKAGRQSNGSSYINNWNFSVDATTGDVQMIGGIKAGKVAGTNSYNFTVDSATGAINSGYNSGSYNFTVDGSGNIVVKGDITANNGKIGGSNGWTIGSASGRGYIYSGSRTSLDSTASGLYVGTDGISAYKSGTGITFKVDSSGNVTINGNITMGSGSSINWGSVSQNNGTATLNGDFSDPTKVAGIVAQNASTAVSDADYAVGRADDAYDYADDALDGVAALANGTYENGTFINGDMIISPTIIADSFYAQPKTVTSAYSSGHFILQSPRSISGNTIYWQNVLDITYGFDGYRPKVTFETSTYNAYQGYFSFEGGDVLFQEGMALGASGYTNKTFSVYSSTIRLDGGNGDSTFEVNNGRIILKQYYQYYYS